MNFLTRFLHRHKLLQKSFLGAAVMINLNLFFQDGMVLRSGSDIPVYGTAAPSTQLEISLAGKKVSAKADANGKFSAKLPSLPDGGPYDLTVTAPATGEKKTVKNVFIGKKPVIMDTPLMSLRLMSASVGKLTDQILRDSDRYPGTFDEVWLASPTWHIMRDLKEVEAHAKHLLPLANEFRKRNIKVGLQVMALGHSMRSTPPPNGYPFKEESWSIDKDGNRIYGYLCPSSPEVRQYLHDSAVIYLRILKLDSLWPDDDMRLGARERMICFCPRCLKLFNAANNSSWTRETLVNELENGKNPLDIRRRWVKFNAEMIEECCAAFRRAVDEAHPSCLMALQRTRSTNRYDNEDGLQYYRGLAGKDNKKIAVRAGGGFYHDLFPRDMIRKSFDVGREAARMKALGFKGAVCNEGENYPHISVQKSPGTLMTEAAMVIAAGAEFSSIYWHGPDNMESEENYDFFMRTAAEHRPFIKAVRDTTVKTELAGCAVYMGNEALALPEWQGKTDETEERLMENGLPMSLPGAAPEVFALSERSALSLGKEDLAKCFAKPVLMDVKAFEIISKKFPELEFVKKVKLNEPKMNFHLISDCAIELFPNGKRAENVFKVLRRMSNDVIFTSKVQGVDDADAGASAIIPTEFGGKIVLVQFLNIWHGWTGYRRECILDALDKVVPGKMAFRLLTSGYAVCPFARVTSEGKTAGVFLLNSAAGDTPVLQIALRRPAYKKYRLQRQMAEPLDLKVISQSDDEIILEIPSIAPWRAVFIEGVEKDMDKLQTVTYLSKADNSMQPALFLPASGNEPRPLAVCLHTWSYGIDKAYEHFLVRCQKRNWHFIFPYFRGPNNTPEACGSDLVVSDLESAVEFVRKNYRVDEERIYLVGGSGGGHAALLMAGRKPELWSAVSAWCPVTDIARWCAEINRMKPNPEDKSYDYNIMCACGGDPAEDERAAAEARHRSPLTHLPAASGKGIVDIATGIHDGHPGVPVSHAVRAFNALAAPEDRISEEDMAYMDKNEAVPEHLKYKEKDDPAFGHCKVLFRRVSGKVRLTLFEGGHSLLPGPAFGWLERQKRNQTPVWYSGDHYDADGDHQLTK